MNVIIRPAGEQDVPLVLAFIRKLADYEKLSHAVTATEADIHASLFGPRPVAEAVIAWGGNEPMGLALFFHNFSTFLGKPGLYLEDLFVEPAYRGRGVGKALLAHLAALALERGCGRFEWSVLDWNTPAIEFYKSLGAEPLAEWTIYRLTGAALENLAASKKRQD